MVTLAEVYIDESGSHGGSPVLCLAGYVFKTGQARLLTRKWQRILNAHGLAYFRMSDCAHGNGPFAGMDKSHRAAIASEMIELIKLRATYGFAVTVNEQEYRSIIPANDVAVGGPYSFCIRVCMIAIWSWAQKNGFRGDFAYFLESGHRNQGEANSILSRVFDAPQLREKYRPAGHGFYDKHKVLPLQAADLLAWQWFTDSKRRLKGATVPRKDCQALLSGQPCHTIHWTPVMLKGFLPHLTGEWSLLAKLPQPPF